MRAIKLTYYNGIMWHTVLLPDGTRAAWPCRLDGAQLPGATARFYAPARVSGTTWAQHREPALAFARS